MLRHPPPCTCLFFFNDTATTEIYTLSLHDALPIWGHGEPGLEPAEHADDELPAVGNDERDTVAGTEAPPEEGAREPARARVELAVRESGAVPRERRPVGMDARRRLEQGGEVRGWRHHGRRQGVSASRHANCRPSRATRSQIRP